MIQAGRAQATPVAMLDLDVATPAGIPMAPLLLRALAHETRLHLLRLLAAGTVETLTLAQELQLPASVVRRHLRALNRVGLVRAESRAGTEVYRVAQHTVRLLNATLVYSIGGSPTTAQAHGRRAFRGVPEPPLACTLCDSRNFVDGVLGELGSALGEARQYHRRIQEMSSQVLTAHEAERKRIARELHDDTAQALTSILVRLRLLERTAHDAAVLQNVEELRELTLGALDSVRRMAMDLRPAALDDLGLVPALQAYAEKFSQNWPIRVTVTADGIRRRLPPDAELVLYRVVQEALTNVAKHSSASLARVSLSRHYNEVALRIQDNGIGFEPGDKPQSSGTGLGLFGMRERLALVGGDVQIESVKGQGTTITAHVPIGSKREETRRAT